MRKILHNRISLIATMAIIVFVIAESFTASRIAHAQATFPAYTIKTESTVLAGPNAGTLLDAKTIARRSDGARVEIGVTFGQPGFLAGDRVRTVELPNGMAFSAYDHLHVVTTYASDAFRKERRMVALQKAPPGCVRSTEQSLPGKVTIMGQETVRAVSNRAMDGNPIVVTYWRALNLNCESLRTTIEEKLPDGSLRLHNEISTTSLVLGEPDPALFAVPADYAEVKPSEYMRREATKLQLPLDSRFEKEAQVRDEEYARSH